jgi:hypothetical protein
MEIVRGSGLQEFAIYCPAFDVFVHEFLGQVRGDPSARVLLVVDQVPPEAVSQLNQQVRLSGGRIRLITISSEPPIDSENIRMLNLGRLDSGEMRKLVQAQGLGLPFEHLDYVVRFADGFVKIAQITWMALQVNPDVQGLESLLGRHDIRGFLRQLLGGLEDDDLNALEAVALMTRVGWEGEVASQGEVLSTSLGLNWRDVRSRIRRIHERLGIVPLAGRYRYVSPQPLAALLARGALADHGSVILRLPERLPSLAARTALFRRLAQLSDHPVAIAMCREFLDRFDSLDLLQRWDVAELWDEAAMADPSRAIRVFRSMLDRSSLAQKQSFVLNGYRVVATLEKIARRSETFAETMRILAELAVVERGQTVYSPSRVFRDRYRVVMAGTEVPFLDRLPLLDELRARPDPRYARLAILALTTAVKG